MKKIYVLLSTVIMLSGFSVFGQKTVVVVEPDAGLEIGALNNAISSATDPGNTIFELKRGGLYLLNGAISHTGYTLHIRAEAGDGARPVLQPAVDALGASSNHFNPGDDLTLEGLYIQGRDELGAIANRQVIVSGTAPIITIDDCFFDYSNQAFLRLTSIDCKVFITNSILRNSIRPENPNNGRIIDARKNQQDTLSIVNSTLYNFSRTIFNDSRYVNLLNLDHNTIFFGCFATGFNISTALEANITNNIFYNYSFTMVPETHHSLFYLDSMYTVGDKTDADRYFNMSNNNWYQQEEIGNIMDEYGQETRFRFHPWDTAQVDTVWYKYQIKDNVFCNKAILDTSTYISAPNIVAFIDAGQVDTSNIFSEALIFKNPPPIQSEYWRVFVENDYSFGSVTPPVPFADEDPTVVGEVTTDAYDFSYNTASKSAKAAEGGLPLGASRWALYTPTSSESIIDNLDNVKTYPNPASEVMTFEIESKRLVSANIIVSDLLGRKLKSIEKQLVKGKNIIPVNLGVITKPGIYFYQIQMDSSGERSVVSGRFVKR